MSANTPNNWARILNSREYGLVAFFNEEALNLRRDHPGINFFTLVRELRERFEGSPRWEEYIEWVHHHHPARAGLGRPPARRDPVTPSQPVTPPRSTGDHTDIAPPRLEPSPFDLHFRHFLRNAPPPQPLFTDSPRSEAESQSTESELEPAAPRRDREFTFTPDPDERGKSYLSTFLELSNAWNRVVNLIPYEIKVAGELGQDYSGVFRDVTSDFLEHWIPTFNYGLVPKQGICLQANFPRLEGVPNNNYRGFGSLLGYLAALSRANPSIRGYPLNLGFNLTLDKLFWSAYSSTSITSEELLGLYLSSFTPRVAGKLMLRLSERHPVTKDSLLRSPLYNTVTNLVTSGCDTLAVISGEATDDAEQPWIYQLKAGPLLVASILEGPCKWARDDLIVQSPLTREDKSNLNKVIETELERGLTEIDLLMALLTIYYRWLKYDTRIREFFEGLRETSHYHHLITDDLVRILGNDGLNNDNIREALLTKVESDDSLKTLLREALNFLEFEEVRKLLKFWTGNSTIPNLLRINRGLPSGLPTASTCFNTLSIPQDVGNQADQLALRIKRALELGGVGTGLI